MAALVSMRTVRRGAGVRPGAALRAAVLVGTVLLAGCADGTGPGAAEAGQPAPYRVAGPVVATPRAPARDDGCSRSSLTFVTTCGGFARYDGP